MQQNIPCHRTELPTWIISMVLLRPIMQLMAMECLRHPMAATLLVTMPLALPQDIRRILHRRLQARMIDTIIIPTTSARLVLLRMDSIRHIPRKNIDTTTIASPKITGNPTASTIRDPPTANRRIERMDTDDHLRHLRGTQVMVILQLILLRSRRGSTDALVLLLHRHLLTRTTWILHLRLPTDHLRMAIHRRIIILELHLHMIDRHGSSTAHQAMAMYEVPRISPQKDSAKLSVSEMRMVTFAEFLSHPCLPKCGIDYP